MRALSWSSLGPCWGRLKAYWGLGKQVRCVVATQPLAHAEGHTAALHVIDTTLKVDLKVGMLGQAVVPYFW